MMVNGRGKFPKLQVYIMDVVHRDTDDKRYVCLGVDKYIGVGVVNTGKHHERNHKTTPHDIITRTPQTVTVSR